MTDEQIALARRAVACKGWKWMPGMLAVEWTAPGMSLTGGRPVRVDDGWHEVGVYVPDITDAATLGCLLALVRVAYGAPLVEFEGETYPAVLYVTNWSGGFYLRRDCGDGDEELHEDGTWSQMSRHDVDDICGDTEAEALVAALEVAP